MDVKTFKHSKRSIEKLNFPSYYLRKKIKSGTINSVVIFKNCYWKVVSYSEVGCVLFLLYVFLQTADLEWTRVLWED